MQRYLLRQQAERKQAGSGTLYNTMRLFWQFYAAEYQTTSPMLGIPRPRVRVAPVPVLAPETAQGDLRRAGEAGSARPPGRHASTSAYLNGTGATAHASHSAIGSHLPGHLGSLIPARRPSGEPQNTHRP